MFFFLIHRGFVVLSCGLTVVRSIMDAVLQDTLLCFIVHFQRSLCIPELGSLPSVEIFSGDFKLVLSSADQWENLVETMGIWSR